MKAIISVIAAVAVALPIFAQDAPQIASVQYWLDDQTAAMTTGTAMEFDIDCSQLSPGLHTLHYRVADSKGAYSPLHEHGFFKLPARKKASAVATLQYWWDDMEASSVTRPYSDEAFILSTETLPTGLHSLKYRVKDDAGRWSDLRSHYFYKSEPTDSARIVSYSYWWNELIDKSVTKTLAEASATVSIDEDLTVPAEARTDYAGHYTARLNVLLRDNHGRVAYLWEDVKYPDNDAPVTDIDADKYVTSTTVEISWHETSGDKMGDYNVYFSKDGEPFMLWLPDTKLTKASFKGERGSTYVFTVTGRDTFGNREKYDETKCVSVTFE